MALVAWTFSDIDGNVAGMHMIMTRILGKEMDLPHFCPTLGFEL
jgi:hypothetical protein